MSFDEISFSLGEADGPWIITDLMPLGNLNRFIVNRRVSFTLNYFKGPYDMMATYSLFVKIESQFPLDTALTARRTVSQIAK